MKQLFVTSLVALGLCACGTNSSSDSPLYERAGQAILQLEAQDEDAVADCHAATDCNDESAACSSASNHACTQLEEDLDELRDPVVKCWQGVQECEGEQPSACEDAARDCEKAEEKLEKKREKSMGCSAIALACAKDPARTGGCGPTVSSECKAYHASRKADGGSELSDAGAGEDGTDGGS